MSPPANNTPVTNPTCDACKLSGAACDADPGKLTACLECSFWGDHRKCIFTFKGVDYALAYRPTLDGPNDWDLIRHCCDRCREAKDPSCDWNRPEADAVTRHTPCQNCPRRTDPCRRDGNAVPPFATAKWKPGKFAAKNLGNPPDRQAAEAVIAERARASREATAKTRQKQKDAKLARQQGRAGPRRTLAPAPALVPAPAPPAPGLVPAFGLVPPPPQAFAPTHASRPAPPPAPQPAPAQPMPQINSDMFAEAWANIDPALRPAPDPIPAPLPAPNLRYANWLGDNAPDATPRVDSAQRARIQARGGTEEELAYHASQSRPWSQGPGPNLPPRAARQGPPPWGNDPAAYIAHQQDMTPALNRPGMRDALARIEAKDLLGASNVPNAAGRGRPVGRGPGNQNVTNLPQGRPATFIDPPRNDAEAAFREAGRVRDDNRVDSLARRAAAVNAPDTQVPVTPARTRAAATATQVAAREAALRVMHHAGDELNADRNPFSNPSVGVPAGAPPPRAGNSRRVPAGAPPPRASHPRRVPAGNPRQVPAGNLQAPQGFAQVGQDEYLAQLCPLGYSQRDAEESNALANTLPQGYVAGDMPALPDEDVFMEDADANSHQQQVDFFTMATAERQDMTVPPGQPRSPRGGRLPPASRPPAPRTTAAPRRPSGIRKDTPAASSSRSRLQALVRNQRLQQEALARTNRDLGPNAAVPGYQPNPVVQAPTSSSWPPAGPPQYIAPAALWNPNPPADPWVSKRFGRYKLALHLAPVAVPAEMNPAPDPPLRNPPPGLWSTRDGAGELVDPDTRFPVDVPALNTVPIDAAILDRDLHDANPRPSVPPPQDETTVNQFCNERVRRLDDPTSSTCSTRHTTTQCADLTHRDATNPFDTPPRVCDACAWQSRHDILHVGPANLTPQQIMAARSYACAGCVRSGAAERYAYSSGQARRVWGADGPKRHAAVSADTSAVRTKAGGPQPVMGCSCGHKLVRQRLCKSHRYSHAESWAEQVEAVNGWLEGTFGSGDICPFCAWNMGVQHYEFAGSDGGEEQDEVFWVCKSCQEVVCADKRTGMGPVPGFEDLGRPVTPPGERVGAGVAQTPVVEQEGDGMPRLMRTPENWAALEQEQSMVGLFGSGGNPTDFVVTTPERLVVEGQAPAAAAAAAGPAPNPAPAEDAPVRPPGWDEELQDDIYGVSE